MNQNNRQNNTEDTRNIYDNLSLVINWNQLDAARKEMTKINTNYIKNKNMIKSLQGLLKNLDDYTKYKSYLKKELDKDIDATTYETILQDTHDLFDYFDDNQFRKKILEIPKENFLSEIKNRGETFLKKAKDEVKTYDVHTEKYFPEFLLPVLIEDKLNFTEFFLDCNINLEKFLTNDRLIYLYNNYTVISSSKL